MKSYRTLADEIQGQIKSGRLRPGDRLAPQREFADAQGIAVSTATRAYGELVRRGLAVGEVGRGTFVRTGPPTEGLGLSQTIGDRVNLATNIPLLPHQTALLSGSAAGMVRRSAFMEASMAPVPVLGTSAARQTVASFISRGNWQPSEHRILFTASGRHALSASLAALASPGDHVGVEALSYQSVAGIAARIGINVVALPMDKDGIVAEGVVKANRRTRLKAIYLQPAVHNPLGITMSARRREEIAEVLARLGIVAIEDCVYSFLIDDNVPLASLMPEKVITIDSLSKRIAPGLTIGWVVAPLRLVQPISEAVRVGALGPSGLALHLCIRWIADGTVAILVRDKRRDATARQRLLRASCPDLTIRADPRAYHAWIELPAPWRSESFMAAAAEQGISVAPATAFAVTPGHAPTAVRIALGSTPRNLLAHALTRLNALVHFGPTFSNVE